MALSRRGRDALAYVGCETTIVNNGIAMRARMIHELNCTKHPIPYGTRVDHFVMEPNYLHIWPRHQFMLIALPNQDKSFTTTLFSPISIFRKLKTADDVMNFFRQYFPDAVSFIGANEIVETFFSSKPQPLISTKCEPHATHNGDMLLMGDAAHSMAPFYAQGMNSAFEDCLVLFDKLKENNFDFPKAFSAYK
ncbi:unnamed protein product [Rotaria sp. Silwood2]|nr:unnamed protein product [Rotaria sp. Silwood2]